MLNRFSIIILKPVSLSSHLWFGMRQLSYHIEFNSKMDFIYHQFGNNNAW